MFLGYTTRLENEIKQLYKDNALKLAKDKSIKIPINIIESPRRKYSVFIGASVLSNVYDGPGNEGYWISKQNWKESGPQRIKVKCFALIR